jgi:hypothetical protein
MNREMRREIESKKRYRERDTYGWMEKDNQDAKTDKVQGI